MTSAEDRARLIEFVSTLAPGRAVGPDGDTLDLDSLALLQVVVYLEQRYGVRLAAHRIEPDDLRSVSGLVSLVDRFG